MNKKITLILLILIILLSFSLRIWKIGYDLPYIYHPDEPIFYLSVAHFFFEHNFQQLDPGLLTSGIPINSFVSVLNAVSYYPYYLVGRGLSLIDSKADIAKPDMLEMGVVKAENPELVYLGRLMSVVAGTLSVFIVFLITKSISDKHWAALLAAFIMAISPTNVIHSRFITPDTYVTLFILLTAFFAIKIGKDNRLIYYIFAGLSLGLSVSSKATGVLIVVLIFTMILLHHGVKGFLNYKFWCLVLVSFVIYILTTPFIFGDVRQVISTYLQEGEHYATGHPGMEGETLLFYFRYLFRVNSLFLIFAIIEMVRGFITGAKKHIAIFIFVIIYFVFVSRYVVRNDRTILPIIPFLIVFAALFVDFLSDYLRNFEGRKARFKIIQIILIVVILGSSVQMVFDLVQQIDFILAKDQVLETARVWINNHLPEQSKIMVESYSPYLERDTFQVYGTRRMINFLPDWYAGEGFDYLVFSQRMYGRYFEDPSEYGREVQQYESLFNAFTLIQKFENPDYEIIVIKIE